MTDDELLDQFERATLPGAAFTHEAHVRAAWCYLSRYPFAEALWRFSTALRRFAEAQGAARKYHETVTVVWMALVAERLQESGDDTWPKFAMRHPDLLGAEASHLARYYPPEILAAERARRTFVLPEPCPRRPRPRARQRPAGKDGHRA